MDPVSITALALGIAELTVSCLKICKKSLGPPQHNDRELQEQLKSLFFQCSGEKLADTSECI